MPNSVHPKYQGLLVLFLCTISICVPAFINNFPFTYSDTGTYLWIGFKPGAISEIRPLTYGLFIRHVSLYESLWLVVFVQAFLVSWFMYQFARLFFPKVSLFMIFLITGLLTATTSIGITTGMLMPDFTTPIIILATAILLLVKNPGKWILLFSSLGLWLGLACHHSHSYILFLVLIGLGLKKLIWRRSIIAVHFSRLLLIGGILIVGYFSIPALHYWRSGKFVSNESSNIFLMSRFQQMGLLHSLLNEKCPEKNYPICKYKDTMKSSFLWDPTSPVKKDGGWVENNRLYREIVIDFFSDPHYFKKFLIRSLETGTLQFFSFNTVVLHPLKAGTWPQTEFEKYLPELVPALMDSAQSKGRWNPAYINFLQRILVFGSSSFLIYFFVFQSNYAVDPTLRALAFFILLFLLCNAYFCGGISMIAPRFQSRIIWVVPLFAAYILLEIRRSSRDVAGGRAI